MRLGAACLTWAALCLGAQAQGIDPIPYDEVTQTVRGRISFDTLPPSPYPGYTLDFGFAFDGGRIGEHFAGQTLGQTMVEGNPFDTLTQPRPSAPLSVKMGAPGQTISISLHRVFGSNVLYPLGPIGQPDPRGRGEGMVAFWFTRDICLFATKVHTQYEDDLGTQANHSAPVQFLFFDRAGALLGDITAELPAGVSTLGFAAPGGAGTIAGVQVLNLDPGGITLDDIAYGCIPFIG